MQRKYHGPSIILLVAKMGIPNLETIKERLHMSNEPNSKQIEHGQSMSFNGHETSPRLEPLFWTVCILLNYYIGTSRRQQENLIHLDAVEIPLTVYHTTTSGHDGITQFGNCQRALACVRWTQ